MRSLLAACSAVRRDSGSRDLALKLRPQRGFTGHCHQKAFGAISIAEEVMKLVPDLDVAVIETSCCGMAGAFGYQAETYEISNATAELSLLPTLRRAETDAIIVADGISCRQQIHHGSGRQAVHVTQVLRRALAERPK